MDGSRFRMVVIFVVAVCCSGTADPQQPAPSRDDTLAWLTSRLPLLGGTFQHLQYSDSFQYDSWQFNGCSFSYHVIESSYLVPPPGVDDDGPSVDDSIVTIDMGRISSVDGAPPAVTFPGPPYLAFLGKSDSIAVTRQSRNFKTRPSGSYRFHSLGLYFGNAGVDYVDLISRMGKAFNNLASICRAQEPANNEPF